MIPQRLTSGGARARLAALLIACALPTGAHAHSSSFGPTELRALPSNPDELWGVAEGWGVVHSTNGGTDWQWQCEESLGTTTVYDVLPWEPGVALVASATGVLRVGADCSAVQLTGLPEGFVLVVERWGDRAVVGWIGDGTGGLYTCDDSTCEATDVVGDAYFPKSLWADGDALWATIVRTDTLGAQLLKLDGAGTTVVQDYPDGDTDPRVVYASGDTVHLWVRPRSDASIPEYRVSTDAGANFRATFSLGYYTDPVPGVVARDGGQTILLGSYYGARTWRSDDAGASFVEGSDTLPAVKCGIDLGGRTLVCADHLADGFSVAVSNDGENFVPLACFEDVGPPTCAVESCDDALAAWNSAAAYGGGECDPGLDSALATEPDDACGCDDAAGIGLALPALALLRRGRRRRRSYRLAQIPIGGSPSRPPRSARQARGGISSIADERLTQ